MARPVSLALQESSSWKSSKGSENSPWRDLSPSPSWNQADPDFSKPQWLSLKTIGTGEASSEISSLLNYASHDKRSIRVADKPHSIFHHKEGTISPVLAQVWPN